LGLLCPPEEVWPSLESFSPWETRVRDLEFIGLWGERPLWALWHTETSVPEWGLRQALAALSEDAGKAVARAVELRHWLLGHRFCGSCGSPTLRREGFVVQDCPQCGKEFWPRVTPAVIMLVHRGDEVLLVRHARSRVPFFSCVAGFVEAGESLEDAAAREIREEASVEIGAPHYVVSQAWPFPHALMAAFFAPWKSGEPVPDGREIIEAGWFHRSNLPLLPPAMSAARRLIRRFFHDDHL